MKRDLEDAGEEEAKRIKVEEPAADVNEEGEDAGVDADVKEEEGEEEEEKADVVQTEAIIKLGFKSFTSGGDACAYFKSIMTSAPKGVNLNEVRPLLSIMLIACASSLMTSL